MMIGSRQAGDEITRSPQAAVVSQDRVSVEIGGRLLQLPEQALRDAISYLRMSTGAHASLEGYAESVAIVLSALRWDCGFRIPSEK
jgi:hypothetical protein